MSRNLPVKATPQALAPVREEKYDELFETLSAFESETAGVLVRTSPRNERVVLYALTLMFVIAIALAAVVKLDRVVTGHGQMISVGGPLYVSPLNAGVVREVRVKAGDIVKKNQVLAVLDPTLTTADVNRLQQRLDSDLAMIERLEAEHSDQAYAPTGENPYNEIQLAIWRQRHAEYISNLAALDAESSAAHAVVSQHVHDAEQYRKRLALAADREKMFDPLVKKGYVSELQRNSLQDTREEATRQLREAQNLIASARESENSARAQRAAYVDKWHADVGAQLVTARNDLDATREQLEKARKLVELGTLVAPSDAIVLKIGKISTGAVATVSTDAGDPQLFTLAPLDAPLEAEIKIPSSGIGFIRVGDPVAVKLDAYAFIRHGTAKGVIKTISEGTFTLDENNQPVAPYFKVRVAVTEVSLRDVPPDFRLIPGMTLAGDVMVGKRTILAYLVEGALKTGSEAMREAQ